ncbi:MULTISPECIES: hypothetical protein [Oerskovia]|jgi:hypothetical protein|uniref:Uncharacterized protein n=1 Tax=Oerskovia rustica TaxID=2762237 RepID=A0ABR8RNB7_9CELL|nr:hypothetical protein [Oerskovia rustica]MBD7949290.1 hypothetical protein [Oerskovia rustica]MDF2846074.1 hypothetical protein [Oerskovia sp.]
MSTQHATEPAPVTAGLSRREIHHAQTASPAPSLWQRLHSSPSHPVVLTVTTMALGILAGIGAGALLNL